MKKTLLTAAVVLILLAGMALMIMYNLGDRILEEVIKAELTDMEKQIEELTEEPGDDGGGQAEVPSRQAVGEGETPGIKEGDNSGTTQENDEKQESPDTEYAIGKNTEPDRNTQQKNAAADTPQKTKENKSNITIDKIDEIKDKITPQDKISAAALVLKRLPKSDIDELKKMLLNGITGEEKEKAKGIVYARFTTEEINQIKEIYSRYMNN